MRRLVEPAHFYLFSHSDALLLLAAEEFRQGLALLEPLVILGRRGELDVVIRVDGGGITGQADACKLGIARALKKWDDQLADGLNKDVKALQARVAGLTFPPEKVVG